MEKERRKRRLEELLHSMPKEEISAGVRRKVLASIDGRRKPSEGSRMLWAAAALFLFALVASAVFLPMLWPYRDKILDHPRDRGMVFETVSSDRG
jgi:hypothetical protein